MYQTVLGSYAVRIHASLDPIRSLIWWTVLVGGPAPLAFAAISVLSLVRFDRSRYP